MNEIRILLIGMSNDCAAYWHSYYKIGIIWGIVLALLYSIAVSRELIHRQENFWPRL